MTHEDSIKTATALANDMILMSYGIRTTKEDAVKLVATALRAAYQKGWDDKQRQLADAMYPR